MRMPRFAPHDNCEELACDGKKKGAVACAHQEDF
jgi:hypothetical protein